MSEQNGKQGVVHTRLIPRGLCAVCPPEDHRLLEALSKLIDDEDYRVRTQADLLLNQYGKSRKAKDYEVARVAKKVLEEHQCYHAWHSK